MLVVGALVVAVLTQRGGNAGEVHVRSAGSDDHAGTPAQPVRSLQHALDVAPPGATVVLAPGRYPAFTDAGDHGKGVVVKGAPGFQTEIAGGRVLGAQGLRFDGVRFTAPVLVAWHPTLRARRPARLIAITGSELSAANIVGGAPSACLTVRDGATDVLLEKSHVTGCAIGVLGPAAPQMSRRVTIRDNRIERLTADGIQFGRWSDVAIERNVIREMRDPAGKIHNDGIQFVGDSRNVVIRDNVIAGSDGQLLFVQDMVGPIERLDVERNLLYDAGAFAVQVQGATRARFVHNTIWRARYGALLVRRGAGTGTVPADTEVVDNILQTLAVMDGADIPVHAGNVIGKTALPAGPGEVFGVDPRFRDPARGDFRLADDSPARGRGVYP